MRFQGGTVEVAENGLKMAPEKDWPGDLERLLFLYLGDLRDSTRRSYIGSLKRGQIEVIQENVRNAIETKIREPRRKFGADCAEKRGIIQGLLGGNQKHEGGNFNLPNQCGFS